MLKRPFRLKKELMAGIFRSGRRATLGPWIIIFLPNQSPATRFGFVATAKIFPSAVLRHKAKRIAREIIRNIVPGPRRGYDIIVMYRFRPEAWNFPELSASLETLLKKIPLMTEK